MRQAIIFLFFCMPVVTIAEPLQVATVPVTKPCLKHVEDTLEKHNLDMCHHAKYIPFSQINPASPEIVGYVIITEKPNIDPAVADRCRSMFANRTQSWLGPFARECRSSRTPTVRRTKNLSEDLGTLARIIELAEEGGEMVHHITIDHDSIKAKYYFDSSALKSRNKSSDSVR